MAGQRPGVARNGEGDLSPGQNGREEEQDRMASTLSVSLSDPSLYINRELSWIRFNRHVLDEAFDPKNPLLERVRFLSISANNLDEFFMIRMAGLFRQVAGGVGTLPADGMTPQQQVDAVIRELDPFIATQGSCWRNWLIPALRKEGISILSVPDLSPAEKDAVRESFHREVFPLLTPLAFDHSHPFPFISNLSLNLAVIIRDPETNEEFFTRVKVPTPLIPRLVPLAGRESNGTAVSGRNRLVFLEDLISANLDMLFPGMEVVASYPFRVTRDADLEIVEDEASDLLTVVEESIGMRRTGTPVRVEVTAGMPTRIAHMIGQKLGIPSARFFHVEVPVGMADLSSLCTLDRPDLRFPPFTPSIPRVLEDPPAVFTAIRNGDILLFHPYDSFLPVTQFVEMAARDPQVLAIKMTLYRVGPDSPVVAALMEAREHGKAVAALIELKARFDEENNIGWARALERAGVHVVFGLSGLKVHAKICMVVRREKEGMVRYVHMGTGNYNPVTGRVYSDIGLFTSDPSVGEDVADLFNVLTGHARVSKYRRLLVAPLDIRSGLIARIERETVLHQKSGGGLIILKVNALVDPVLIRALYQASRAGVRIHLQVRGICCLRPGVPGVSETITVTTLVGRFLEHARIAYFRNGGDEEVFAGSADLMPRNLDRRVEVLFPILDPGIRRSIIDIILPVHLKDTVNARRLLADEEYEDVKPEDGAEPFDAHQWCIDNRGIWHRDR